MNNAQRGICMTILALSTALSAAACVAESPTEGQGSVTAAEDQDKNATKDENVGEAVQLLCEGYHQGAACFAKCGSTWYNIGYPAPGHCEEAAQSACLWQYAGACWGNP